MRQYELTYLISDDVPEGDINKVSGKVNGYIADAKGKVLKEESWGRRKLAYPIKKQQFATYITLNFELEPENLREIEKDIMHAPEILRHLTIVRDFGKEELTLTAEDIAETEEIEEVVGGEKSFEAIEGETEESYDLMAKRDEEKIEEESEETKTEEELPAEEAAEEKPAEELKVKEEVKAEEKKARKPRAKKTEEVKEEAGEVKKEEKKIKKETPKKPTAKTASTKTSDKPPVSAKAEAAVGKVKTKAVKSDNVEDEADRLAKLDKELDDILGDDL
ncbi:MAG: 30S ribosomal protein S6 [Patescibacteria group bacterium]